MDGNGININQFNSIIVSRNKPLGFVVGVAGFIGSHLAEKLLEKGIQIVGVDNLSTGSRKNLDVLVKDKDFHFINQSIQDPLFTTSQSGPYLKLPRLDYAFFIIDPSQSESSYQNALVNFLKYCKSLSSDHKPKVVFLSSINLYSNKLSDDDKILKEAEKLVATFAKSQNLNARIIRLADLFGPRMHFRTSDPVASLIKASLLDKLQDELTTNDFSSRCLFIDDAISLIIKSVLSGSTAQKIYDGSLEYPIKVSEIKQILLDPIWHESKDYHPTDLPPWPTPNLKKTMRELSWKPVTNIIAGLKQTLHFFRENRVEIEDNLKPEIKAKNWSFNSIPEKKSQPEESNSEIIPDKGRGDSRLSFIKIKKLFLIISIVGLILYGLLYPFVSLIIGSFSVRNNLNSAQSAILAGDFKKATKDISRAKQTLNDTQQFISSFQILKKIKPIERQLDSYEEVVRVIKTGVEGIDHAVLGAQSLFDATRVISGGSLSDVKPLYQKAQLELTSALYGIDLVQAKLNDPNFVNNIPYPFGSRAEDLATKIKFYSDLVGKAKTASFLLPKLTAIDDKKSYLILLENNLNLTPTGGKIDSYAILNFENGKVTKVEVNNASLIDSKIKDQIKIPDELSQDLNKTSLSFVDLNYDPDFPTTAKLAQLAYKNATGEVVNGVFALDLTANQKLADVLNGVDLINFGEQINKDNFFEKLIVGQTKPDKDNKSYYSETHQQILNKIFFLNDQNWAGIIKVVGESLDQKHILAFVSDPETFSLIASQNWTGVIPRGVLPTEGEYHDFLYLYETDLTSNLTNFRVDKRYSLVTNIDQSSSINHKLTVYLKPNGFLNQDILNKDQTQFYKSRIRFYLPLGSKLKQVVIGDTDVTTKVTSFSDYGRTGYSFLAEMAKDDVKSFVIEYSLAKPITFKDNNSSYKFEILKQPGTSNYPFEWILAYPNNLKIGPQINQGEVTSQGFVINTDLSKDRSIIFTLQSK